MSVPRAEGDAETFENCSLDHNDIRAVYDLLRLERRCEVCGTSKTVLWRKGWYRHALGAVVSLCNACGLRYTKGRYKPPVYSHRLLPFTAGAPQKTVPGRENAPEGPRVLQSVQGAHQDCFSR